VQGEPIREQAAVEDWQPVKELRESLFLIVLMVSSMSAYVGLGAVAVRLFAGIR
jgi:hypothetical protein